MTGGHDHAGEAEVIRRHAAWFLGSGGTVEEIAMMVTCWMIQITRQVVERESGSETINLICSLRAGITAERRRKG